MKYTQPIYINALIIDMLKNFKNMFLIFKIEYVLVYPEEGKRMKFTDVTVEGEDTKKKICLKLRYFAQYQCNNHYSNTFCTNFLLQLL